jgi:pilus assembly protein CpaD
MRKKDAMTRTPNREIRSGTMLHLAAPVLIAALAIGGCQSDGSVTDSSYSADYRSRHPIALTYAPTKLDIFTGRNAAGLDPRQSQDVRDFALDYRRTGRGPMLMLVPNTSGNHYGQKGVSDLRSKLAAMGVGSRSLQVSKYQSTDSSLAAPIRLSYTKMQAKVANECGLWRNDIGEIQNKFQSWKNNPWYNMGCAYQTQFAAQVADPLDLVRPTAETRVDTVKRMSAIEKLRRGQDPSIQWNGGEASVKGGS